jgi:3-dehydroquinate dehydratase/shikimate dehydrogenase
LRKIAVALASPDGLAEAAAAGADLVELRLDLFPPGFDLGRFLRRRRPLPVIATLRPPREGGRSELPDAARIKQLLFAAGMGAEYVDVEWDAATPAVLDDLREAGAKVIVSRHAFDRMPDLASWADEIAAMKADVVKVVGMALSASDCEPPLRVLERAELPTIAIAMGRVGLATRVLCLKYDRCFLTFAALPGGGTAPGQITVGEMLEVYRVRSIGPNTEVRWVEAGEVVAENRRLAEAGLDAVAAPLAAG